MHIDGRTLAHGTTLNADLCIIGAGAAGISLALELDGTSLKVLMLESGGFETEPETQALAKGEVVGLPTFPLDVSRLRKFGGNTGHWGGFCRVFDPIDFEVRPWVPHSGWPITHRDLEPFYDRAHALCQIGPPDYEPADWLLNDTPPLPLAGSDVRTRLIQYSPPTRFGVRYREPIVRSKNIQLCLYSNVVQITPSANGKQIEELAVATLAGNRFKVRARNYVLATGGIENARLLLASNQVMPRGVGNDKDLVGRYFADHINLDSATLIALTDRYSFDLYQRTQRTVPRQPRRPGGHSASVMGLLDLSPEAQRRERTLNYSGEVQTTFFSDHFLHSDRFANPMQSDTGKQSRFEHIKQTLKTLYRNASDAVAALFRDDSMRYGYYEIMSIQEQAPNPDSRVLLSEKRDALGVPLARLDWRLNELDRHTVKAAMRLIASAFGAAGIARLKISFDIDAPEWPTFMQSSWHHCGTTRMHADPNQGVVDANCRVHGIANLYIAGSSVFTTNSSANPTVTLIALALRLAQHLKRQYRL